MAAPSSSWSCHHCTFLNPPSQNPHFCQVCLNPSSSSSSSSASSSRSQQQWPCLRCTFLNSSSHARCAMCDRPSASFSSSYHDFELHSDEISAIGPARFRPLRPCSSKRPVSSNAAPPECIEIPEDDEEEKAKLGFFVMDKGSGNAATLNTRTLKIMSYNVYFNEDLEVQRRMDSLADLIVQYSPDLICFQEVTPNIYRIFKSSKWWKEYTCSVSHDRATERRYFCMQMSKLPISSFSRKPFGNSIMGRELCIAETNIAREAGTELLVVATSHLESPCPAPPTWNQMYSKERVTQAEEALGFLNGFANVIFGGDMNWDEKLDGALPLPAGWVDAWVELMPNDSGWTYDTKANRMLSANRTLQKRLDRFLCKLSDFKINSIEIIGKEAISGASYQKKKKVKNAVQTLELPVLPSDHFGLLLTLVSTEG